MKPFVIKPAPGKTTVSLVAHRYFNKAEAAAAGRERGTQAIYLGSFSSHLNPGQLVDVERITPGDKRHGISLKEGVVLNGRPFELNAADVHEIREWLLANGSWMRAETVRHELQLARDRERAEERVRLEVQLRAELIALVRPQLKAEIELEMQARRGHPLVEAVRVVEAAGAAVREEAERLKAAGHRLAMRRGRAMDPSVAELLEMTLALRLGAFAGFEDACKEAKLMAGRRSGAAKRKGLKAR